MNYLQGDHRDGRLATGGHCALSPSDTSAKAFAESSEAQATLLVVFILE
jgi:hypothetical protein